MNGVWGASRRSKKAHFFVDGRSLCNRASKLEFVSPQWNEADPSTCETCLHMKTLFSKGMVPANS